MTCPIPVADLYFLLPDKDSPATQARHYKTLQEMYKKPKPNQDAVCQILDLEFQARRAFIDSDNLKEEDRPAKIFEAYLCFKELHHVCTCCFWLLHKASIVADFNTYLHCR